MGLKNLKNIVAALLAAGIDPATPACVIENGTLLSQKARVDTIAGISAIGFEGPAIIVIGEVVRLARFAPLIRGEASRRRAGRVAFG